MPWPDGMRGLSDLVWGGWLARSRLVDGPWWLGQADWRRAGPRGELVPVLCHPGSHWPGGPIPHHHPHHM